MKVFLEIKNIKKHFGEGESRVEVLKGIDIEIEKGEIQSGGEYYTKTTKDKIGKFNKLLIFSFWFYNRGGALLKKHTRKKKINKEQPLDAIDPIEIPYLDKIKRKH